MHAAEELQHALIIAKQIDYLGGDITATPKPVKTSDKAEDMLRFDLENESETILDVPRAGASVRVTRRVRDRGAHSRDSARGAGASHRIWRPRSARSRRT